MKKVQKQKISRKMSELTAILFYAGCGILLLVFPNFPIMVANYLVATVLTVVGIFMVISYFRSSYVEAMTNLELSTGLLLGAVGTLIFLNPEFLSNLIPVFLGITLIAGGCIKLQMSWDLHRTGERFWWTVTIASVISIILGILALIKPSVINAVLFRFIGISMIAEAIIDIITFWFVGRRVKEYKATIDGRTVVFETSDAPKDAEEV